MKKKYLKYSAEDFAQDLRFIAWVTRGRRQKDWENFVLKNPILSKDVDAARRIVTLLRLNTKNLSDTVVDDVYNEIDSFHTSYHQRPRIFSFKRVLKYAAILVLFLSIGIAVSIFHSVPEPVNQVKLVRPSSVMNETKIILSSGEEIVLKDKETQIEFNSLGNQIRINRDSILGFNHQVEPSSMVQVLVPYGKRSNMLLSDGTIVWLNAGSKLEFPQKFSGVNRKVYLKGEAYFSVAKNKNIPFVVSSENLNVSVHGTQFNFKNYVSDQEIEVVLVEGSVSLKENDSVNLLGKDIQLVPNQLASYNRNNKSLSLVSNVNVSYYTSWRNGLLEFNRESIVSVMNRLSRFYNVGFVADNQVGLDRKISGTLDLKESLEDVLKVVSDAASITFKIDKDHVFINSK